MEAAHVAKGFVCQGRFLVKHVFHTQSQTRTFGKSLFETVVDRAIYSRETVHRQIGLIRRAAAVFAAVRPRTWEASQAMMVRDEAANNTERPGKFKEAEGFYLRIKQEYPNSEEAQDIDRFIVSVQQKQR